MIQELVNFMEILPEEFKSLGAKPREGLHIEVCLNLDKDGTYRIDTTNFKYELYSKKMEGLSPFLEQCMEREQHGWCIDTNKCFDLPTKAIHSCSPFLVAFKRDHLEGGVKFADNYKKNKKQIYERFSDYFTKALDLLSVDQEKYEVFKYFFVKNDFSNLLRAIEEKHQQKRDELDLLLAEVNEEIKNTSNKDHKEQLKQQVKEIELKLLSIKELANSDYILFYLNEPIEVYKDAHAQYLSARLFNTDEYNTKPNEDGVIYGTSNFMNGFNTKMPFLMHQSAPFDITGRISNIEAKLLYEFSNVLSNKVLPQPLPLFIYEEELEHKMLGIFKENNFKLNYQELIKELLSLHKEDLSNYYLLFWQNTKDGLVFKDFDFVSRFEYKLSEIVNIRNLFQLKTKNVEKIYPAIQSVFDIEQQILKPFIHNKYLKVSYFSELSKDGYEELDGTYQSYAKYRKSVYDYVYKSQRTVINEHIFYEMVFNAIKDDLKNGNGYGVKDKLNIWYSAQHLFNLKNKIDMGDKLKDYQSFVAELISDEGLKRETNDAYFAFTAGMVIDYIISKSKSADTSYQLLEPYLQQSRCAQFKKAIANDFARYKHENFSKNFERAAAFVLSYDTDVNLKNLLPEILSGVFANNQLYSNKSKTDNHE